MIGIFDSGLGGLTALCEARKLLPHTDIVYFGDTARCPYGVKSEKTLLRYTEEAISLLEGYGADRILAACGTVSSVALPQLRGRGAAQLYGVCNEGLSHITGESIAVIATPATVRSHAFRDAILARLPTARVTETACPLFVAMAENGLLDPHDPVVYELVRRSLAPIKKDPPDTLVLGCTHFPLLSEAIQAVLPEARLYNVGKEAAMALLPEREDENETGKTLILLSDLDDVYEATVRRIIGKDTAAEIRAVSI